ncbi:hypothetical protein [Haloarcula amylovorans]|uniref:hypothetical protein n=1 Tax=Haloarcula amylovorans TaxID=2562280 RepID=UPI001FD8258C|nr:hypothetical protein [Halomicroarcula amylolytica]
MERRALLKGIGTAAVAALAGCASSANPGDDGTPTDTPTDAPDPDPRMTDSTFTVTASGSGTQKDAASVDFDGDTVAVEGTIWGANGCKTGKLLGTDYDAEADELTVAVGTKDREDAGDMCTQAIVEIEYRATVTFDHGLPATVVVTHDHGDGGREVTTARQ